MHEVNQELMRNQSHSVQAKLIDVSALNASKKWNNSSHRKVDWDWVSGYDTFKFRYPKRFEMALWHNRQLISLSLGSPSYQGTKLRLDYIEANPDKPADLKVFQSTFIAMVAYAQAIGAEELRVMNPVNEQVRKYYERFGLTYISKSDYLYIKL